MVVKGGIWRLGRKFGEKIIASVEYSRGLFHDGASSPTNGSSRAALGTTFAGWAEVEARLAVS